MENSMETERKDHFARGLSTWLRSSAGRPDATLWIDMQVAIGMMTEIEAAEFEEWLGGVV
jgi:hypothetical protein